MNCQKNNVLNILYKCRKIRIFEEKEYEYKVDLYVDNRIIRTEKVPDVTYNPI